MPAELAQTQAGLHHLPNSNLMTDQCCDQSECQRMMTTMMIHNLNFGVWPGAHVVALQVIIALNAVLPQVGHDMCVQIGRHRRCSGAVSRHVPVRPTKAAELQLAASGPVARVQGRVGRQHVDCTHSDIKSELWAAMLS